MTLAGRSYRPPLAELNALGYSVMSLPNFIIIGAAKTGTTTLYECLREHPDVYMPRCKQPHFFDYNFHKGINDYSEAHFCACGDAAAIGEATPTYLMLPFVANRIYEHLSHARLIVILRNPVEVAYSAWWMLWSRGQEVLPFEEAIAANMQDLQAGRTFEGRQGAALWHSALSGVFRNRVCIRCYLDEGYYAVHLKRYLNFFPRKQIKILLTEDLRRDPVGVVRDLWSFLGVSPDHPVRPDRMHNSALTGVAVRVVTAIRRAGLETLVGKLPDSLRTRIKRVLSTASRPEMTPETRRMLVAHYAPHNEALTRLLGRDMSHWNDARQGTKLERPRAGVADLHEGRA